MHHGHHYDYEERRGLGSWLRSRLLLGGLGYVIYRLWKSGGSTQQDTSRIGHAGSSAGTMTGEGVGSRTGSATPRG